MTGWLVVLGFLAMLGGVTLWRVLAFQARWSAELVPGVPLRLGAPLSAPETLRLRLCAEGLRAMARERWPDKPELLRFAVEVQAPGKVTGPTVPDGVLPGGHPVGGTVRSEQALPWTRRLHVACVANERAWTYLLHEYCRHILAEQLHGQPDAAHALAELGRLEKDAVKRLAWIRSTG